jgi:hypothetical protein
VRLDWSRTEGTHPFVLSSDPCTVPNIKKRSSLAYLVDRSGASQSKLNEQRGGDIASENETCS